MSMGHTDDTGDISLSSPSFSAADSVFNSRTPRSTPQSFASRFNVISLDDDDDDDDDTDYAEGTPVSGPSRPVLPSSLAMSMRLPSVDLSSPSTPFSLSSPKLNLPQNHAKRRAAPSPLLDEETSRNMSRWVKEIVVCNFDLERGPVVERRAAGRRWGVGEKENVAFSSFPDTSLFAEGSILFSFKIRHIPPDPASLSLPEPPSPMPDRLVPSTEDGLLGGPKRQSSGEKAEEYRRWDERGREWLYGFVWFEQRRDTGIKRGYMQKSLVILTHLPFPTLFSNVLSKVAPAFFEHGYSALETACHSIASWPDPTPDTLLDLPFMCDLIHVKLPDTTEAPQIGKAFSTPDPQHSIPLLASLPHATPLRAFATFLPSLWSLWECLILAEPILVIAPDPKTCSDIVWWLRDLFRPIPPAGDFRPYLHIHDLDFPLLVNSNKPQAGLVVGVTNPFFRNAAAHWPNVISIPSERPKRNTSTTSSSRPEQPEGFISRRHRSIQKDRVLLKRLEALVAEGKLDDPAGNEALRTHFQQLTERFLVPLNRYFQTLIPLQSSPNPAATPIIMPSPSPSPIRPFSLPTFLSHLRTHGPNPLNFKAKGLSTKSRVESDFYAAFCMGGCFAGWLSGRVDSLGLAVERAQSATSMTLAVPIGAGGTTGTSDISATGLGIGLGIMEMAPRQSQSSEEEDSSASRASDEKHSDRGQAGRGADQHGRWTSEAGVKVPHV
ncbi:hypothetical protein P7C73_g4202, partial [Tremellales sp. Uapishka_1]